MRDRQALQGHAGARQRVAWVQAQGLGGFRFAPLNQGGQRAIEQTLAVSAHADLPIQHAFGGASAHEHGGATVDALHAQRHAGGFEVGRAGHKVHQAGLLGDCGLQGFVVHVKEACGL